MAFQRILNLSLLTLGLGGIACTGAHAEGDAQQAIYGSAGPFGVGLGWGHRIDEHWASRIYVNSGTVGHARTHEDLEDVRYELTWKASPGLSALADYFLWQNSGWRLSAGLIAASMHTDLKGEADALGQYRFNHHAYGVSQVGTVTGRLKNGPVSLYVGGGWESKPLGDRGWRFVSDAGVFYAGRASVTLDVSGAAANPALQADVETERRRLRKQSFGAAISLGAAYAF
jgi:hypothetical protein